VGTGWIVEETPEAGVPPLAGKRAKIVYKLTADGKEHFAELMSACGPEEWDDDSFGIRFAFFGRTDAAVRLRILEGRRRRLEERADTFRAGAARRTAERVDAYTLELQRHGLESVEREVRWLNELIATERSTDVEAQTHLPPH
jgi:DNA-binding PadR family transcriptional regulator